MQAMKTGISNSVILNPAPFEALKEREEYEKSDI